jgi:hypothetical protein
MEFGTKTALAMVSGIHCETCESAFELLNAFVKNMVILTVAMQKDQRPSAAADLIIETYAVHINHHNVYLRYMIADSVKFILNFQSR